MWLCLQFTEWKTVSFSTPFPSSNTYNVGMCQNLDSPFLCILWVPMNEPLFQNMVSQEKQNYCLQVSMLLSSNNKGTWLAARRLSTSTRLISEWMRKCKRTQGSEWGPRMQTVFPCTPQKAQYKFNLKHYQLAWVFSWLLHY